MVNKKLYLHTLYRLKTKIPYLPSQKKFPFSSDAVQPNQFLLDNTNKRSLCNCQIIIYANSICAFSSLRGTKQSKRQSISIIDCFVPTNDEFSKLVIISLFEKRNFSLDSRNDGYL